MSGVETRIYEALAAQLAALALTPAMPIAWPNVDFKPPATGYLRASFLPAATGAFARSGTGSNEHRGIFQIDVFWPENKGETEPSNKAAAIIAHFKRGTVLSREGATIRIDDPPYRGPSLQEPGFLQIPVSVPYHAFIPS
jgi:hypothetical protein